MSRKTQMAIRKGMILSVMFLGASVAAEYEIGWYTIGDSTRSGAGGTYDLRGTIGQPDAGQMSGGNYELGGGFWFAVAIQDCNGNGIPDDEDIAEGTSQDINLNGVPDECEDCNENGLPDECDLDPCRGRTQGR